MCADHIKENDVGMDKYEIRKAISHVKSEDEKEHERNIKNMIQDDDYKSPWKIKDATVATGLKTVTYSSDSDENPEARKEPIKGSHLGKYFVIQKMNPPTWTQSSQDSVSLDKEDLGLLAGEAIPKISFKEGKT